MRRYPRLAVVAAIVLTVSSACGSTASIATPSPTAVAATASPTAPPTSVPTVQPATATAGPTLIPYPGPPVPSGTVTLQISAQNVRFDKTDLAAPANTPFVIAFVNKDDVPHNVAIKLDTNGPLIFNPLPAIPGPSRADYFISGGLPAGTYRFICTVHPTMTGTLSVS